MNKTAKIIATKVPEVTLLFWVMKVAATTLGETSGDAVSMSILISCFPLFIILIYTFGQKKLFRKLNPISKDDFLQIYNREYHLLNQIDGTALYFVRDTNFIPPYILHNIFKNGIFYKENILVSIIRRNGPWGVH